MPTLSYSDTAPVKLSESTFRHTRGSPRRSNSAKDLRKHGRGYSSTSMRSEHAELEDPTSIGVCASAEHADRLVGSECDDPQSRIEVILVNTAVEDSSYGVGE